MKKCTYCGKEYPDDAVQCPVDRETLVSLDPQGVPAVPPPVLVTIKKSENGRYLKFEDVPWYRREPGALAFVGVLFCGFVTIALCVICLTGDVYKKSYDREGNLEVWGVGNKIASVLILVLQTFIIWAYHQSNSVLK